LRHFRKRNIAAFLAVGIACICGASAYAFTASNTVPAHTAGGGQGAVSGYTVSSPTNYTFSADGTSVTEVDFDLNAAAADVAVALTATSTPVHADWVDCGASGASSPYAVSCTFSTPIANGSDNYLSVAAVSSGTVTIAP
jgi:hypothetical protein